MITLTSDFNSPYPASMKGVILERTDTRLVDVAHDLPRHDVRTAAFWLREVLPCFPPAVHLVVVDPGVGTDRAAIVIRAGSHVLVGPDNGVLFPAARWLVDDERGLQPFEILVDRAEFGLETCGAMGGRRGVTFHGRDVFAPAAAAVHETGTERLSEVEWLAPIDRIHELTFPEPDVRERRVDGEVLVVDDFGNAITNVPGSVLIDRIGTAVSVDGRTVPFERSYAMVGPGTRLLTVGSHGNVELAVNRGRGDEAFGVSVGDRIRISW